MAALIEMRDGSTTTDPRLGRLKQFDERSRRFPWAARAEVLGWDTRVHTVMPALDQLSEGTCVGHGYAHEANATPVPLRVPLTHEGAVSWFDAAALIDEWPNTSSRTFGTSVLAGAKVGVNRGYFKEYRWAFSLLEALNAVCTEGPVVMGTVWRSGMYSPNAAGQLSVYGTDEGGHCWLVYGVVKAGDINPLTGQPAPFNIVLMQNSWGVWWGKGGRAWMSVVDFDAVRRADGEVCIPVGRKDPTAVEPVKPKPAGKWKWIWNRIRRTWQKVWVPA
jgi:hypothetical protein